MQEKCVYYRFERGDVSHFNLPRSMANLPGLIKFPYIIRGQQYQHALKDEDRDKDRCTVCKRQIHTDLVYTWY